MCLRGHFRKIGLILEDAGHGLLQRVALMRADAAQHFVKYQAEGVDIGALIHLFPLGLFRRHIGGRPKDHTRLGLADRYGGRLVRRRHGSSADLGQSEVEHLHQAIRTNLDVSRLEIPMDDAFFVRVIQRVRDLPRNRRGFIEAQRTFLDAVGQRGTFDQLHHQIIGPDIVQRTDIGVIERRDDFRFPRKAFAKLLCGDLDGGIARQARVLGAIHLAHATLTD